MFLFVGLGAPLLVLTPGRHCVNGSTFIRVTCSLICSLGAGEVKGVRGWGQVHRGFWFTKELRGCEGSLVFFPSIRLFTGGKGRGVSSFYNEAGPSSNVCANISITFRMQKLFSILYDFCSNGPVHTGTAFCEIP